MKSSAPKVVGILLIVLFGFLGWGVYSRLQRPGPSARRPAGAPAPVEVAPVERGPIELRRTFSGALEATARTVVAPKVGGRIERLAVDLADPVSPGEVVAELDDDEYVQAVVQARAELAVARANLAEARSALEIASREMRRVETLRRSGVASESQYDAASAEQLARQARLEVARAQLTRAEAALETANIRLGYTKITAEWRNGPGRRLVAERFVDAGDTVSANTPLFAIVELNPLTGVIYATERDYALLRPDQPVSLTTDAYPGERFSGRIARISPVFRQNTRQARIELAVDNDGYRLKPGMFIRVTVVLDRVDDAVIVPEPALTRRGDRTGVFRVDPGGRTVSWREVAVGIREDGRVQVAEPDLEGRVVVLGQQLVDDGSRITIPAEEEPRSAGSPGSPSP